MTLQEMFNMLRFHSGLLSSNDIEEYMLQDINRVYRSLAEKYDWNALIVRGEEFDTEQDTDTYYLPTPLIRIVGNRVIYDVDNTSTGPVTITINDTAMGQFWTSAVTQSAYAPMCAQIIGGSGSLKATMFLGSNLSGGSSAIVVDTTADVDAGDWVQFMSDNNQSLTGEYYYQIRQVSSSTLLTLTYAYVGPGVLSGTALNARPLTTKRLRFFPEFSEYGKTVRYDWVRQPIRLQNIYDVPEVPELCNAIIFTCLAENFQYHRPEDLNYSMAKMGHFRGLAQQALREARGNAAQG